ncbi:MAG: sigma 54-interacting transcriptional regulator [Myxococcota bacterium]|nr:sigma 54-interacting transcriptional regulator [Myxococcota bacterium]
MRESDSILSHQRYEPGEVLGRGAQGIVLRVVDREQPARALVAKVWRARTDDEWRVEGEFALLARLRIRGLVRAHDFGRDDRSGVPFFVEDFIDGREAGEWVSAVQGTAANARLLAVATDVAATLAGLHEAGFTHGDTKPAHVRVVEGVGPRGNAAQAVLLDLGAAASRAHQGRSPGAYTPSFAAPEVRAGEPATSVSDLYGLGALAWAVATKRPPPREDKRAPLRSLAPWVQPGVADVIERLLALHPRDRPGDALEVLRMLGTAGQGAGIPASPAPPPMGRERELDALGKPSASGVRYIVGPSGSGKSHLLRELVIRTLLADRDARCVTFPNADPQTVSRLIAYFRGADHAWPFVRRDGATRVLLALDDMHAAPQELVEAVDAWRCRLKSGAPHPDVLASVRTAPEGADRIELGALQPDAFARLCHTLGIERTEAIEEAARASDRNPGWLVAAHGRMPITRDTVLERARALSRSARDQLATIALCGGTAPERICDTRAIAELLRAALVTRHTRGVTVYALTAPVLASDIASALVTFDIADRVAAALLDVAPASSSPSGGETDPAALLAVAQGPVPPARREELLDRAASRARVDGLRTEEIEALFALAANPVRRTPALLCRLERLNRCSARPHHPQLLAWLDDAAQNDAAVRSLALRRHAEREARESNADAAREFANQARIAAREIDDAVGEALAIATMGAVALWRADWIEAEAHLSDARARLAPHDVIDPEEIARLDHNFGVVALYRARTTDAIEAFQRALESKRRLGDRAGVRSSLLNLGLAFTRAGSYDEAVVALDEAIALAHSLEQRGGRAWCLAARAEVEVRRGRAPDAERWVAEAEASAGDAPAVVKADLLLLRASVALLDGDGRRAMKELARIDSAVRAEQAVVDIRAWILEARGHLALLPVDRRRASRIAIDAIRRARTAGLPEVEDEALTVLRSARGRVTADHATSGYDSVLASVTQDEAGHWEWLSGLATGQGLDDAALALARIVAAESGAERAIVACVDAGGRFSRVWGIDLDGISLASPDQRLDREIANAALACGGAVYQRDVQTSAGRGSRLAVATEATGDVGPASARDARALVVVEHRFQSGHFDRISDEKAGRWATLAGVLARLARHAVVEPLGDETGPLLAMADSLSLVDETTTVIPSKEPRRVFPGILGESAAMRRALAKLDAAIDSDLPVLLVGETGTGKELFARALHDHSARARAPFVALNCGAIPDTLFEAELFGHARGAFTGADRARPGLLARCEGGTLLLDEIGELPLPRQAALLRALETRRYRPVGSDDERDLRVRVVAATNRELAQAVESGTFRRDLLYRLNVVELRVPPLRERKDDVALLANAFLKQAGSSAEIAPAAAAALAAYRWPGNVRELEHVMQRLAGTAIDVLRVAHLPRALRSGSAVSALVAGRPRRVEPAGLLDERTEVERALERASGNISHAARALGITRHGLKKRMLRLGMRGEAVRGPRGALRS